MTPRRTTVIDNDAHVCREFSSDRAARRWAKEHGHKLRRCWGGTGYYSESVGYIPGNHGKVED